MAKESTPARWYMLNKDGMATLCTDKPDAEQEAKKADAAYPNGAPHRAVLMGEVAPPATAQAISAEPAGSVPPDAHGAVMGAAYDFRDAHLTGSANEKRSAHEVLDTTVRDALRASHGQAPAQPADPSITLDFKQATELLEMFGGEAGLVTLQHGGAKCHSGPGLYAWYSDLPEEGAEFLGAEPDDEASPQAADTGAAAPLLDYAMQIAHERELRVTGNPHDEDGAKLRFEAAAMRHIATGAAQGAGITAVGGMVSVCKEDANRYCEILTLLGMEEEGDPVAEVQRLQDRAAHAIWSIWEALPGYLIDNCEGTPVSEEMLQHALSKMLADPQYKAPDWAAAPQPAPPADSVLEDARQFPAMTPELSKILGTMCFQCITFAQALRAAGHQIETRAEAEQAAVLHWMLGHYFRSGEDGWREAASDEMERMSSEAAARAAQKEGEKP